MLQPTAAEIEKLCDDWCAATVNPDGGMTLSAKTEGFGLLENGVVFHKLCHEALCAALVGLSKVVLGPRLNTMINQDHYWLWSWCGELLLSPCSQLFPVRQHEIRSLYQVSLHAALAHADCHKRKLPKTKNEFIEQSRIPDLQPHHEKQFLKESILVLSYLAFPLLEAVLKRACANYVAFDGQVTSNFTVIDKNGKLKKYGPQSGFHRRCNSLRDLLFLHHTTVAGPRLKSLLDRFRSHLRLLDGTKDPFDLIFNWRNQSLHGSTGFHTIGGSMLNLSLLISLFDLEQDFDQYRSKILWQCRLEAQPPHKIPWSFYPPY